MRDRRAVARGVLVLVVVVVLVVAAGGWFVYNSLLAPKEGVVYFGVVGPQTGRLSRLWSSYINAINLAVDEINGEGNFVHEGGGVKVGDVVYKLQYIAYDSASDPATAVAAAERLIEENNVKVILGSMLSGATLAMMKVTGEKKVIQITSVSTHPDITAPGKRHPYMFRNKDTALMRAKSVLSLVKNVLNLKTVALIAPNDEFGLGSVKSYTKIFNDLGVEVVDQALYTPGTEDFLAVLQGLYGKNPDALYLLINTPGDFVNIVRQAREVGFENIVVTAPASNPEWARDAGEAAVGVYVELPFAITEKVPHVWEWANKYKERFGKMPDFIAAPTYDAVNVIALAFKVAGTVTDTDAIRDALHQIEMKGVYTYPDYILKFDENGQAAVTANIGQYNENLELEVVAGPAAG